jgi:phosphoglycerate kinase
MGLDIGPATITLFSDAVKTAKTIVWNGPLGMFELAPFSKGTFALVHAVANSGALTIVGGGAFLELLEGKTLPGVAALEQ